MNIIGKIKSLFGNSSTIEEVVIKGRGLNKQPKFEIHKSKDDKFYFNLISPNGKVLCTSETYNSKQSAYVGIAAVQNYGEQSIKSAPGRVRLLAL